MKYRRATITDIAKAGGISPSTVSRALNNHPRISHETKEKIMKLAKEMRYTPNILGRGLVKKKSFLVGLLVYDFRNPFYAELTRSIQETAEESGFWVIQASTDDDDERTHSLVDSMIKMGVEGIIFASCKMDDPIVESLIDDNFPVVLANRRMKKDKGDYIIVDNTYGAYLVVNHLIRLGHQRIAMVGGPRNLSTSVDRHRGYMEAMKEKGLEIDTEIIKNGTFFSQDTGYTFTKRMMRQHNPPKAIFCGDDYIALGSMKALGELGLRVPSDVAVVGFDDVEIASHPLIQLTTISQDAEEMGMLAAKALFERIEGKSSSTKKILLEPRLIIRKSCGYKLLSTGIDYRETNPLGNGK